MFSKLFLIIVVLGLFSIGQAQWNLIPPSQLPILNNDIYFQKGLQVCKQKIVEAGKVFKVIMYIRAGPGYEYNLNDTSDNVHICRVARIAPPVYVNLTLYTFVQINQGKQVISDQTVVLDSQTVESDQYQKIQSGLSITDNTGIVIDVPASNFLLSDDYFDFSLDNAIEEIKEIQAELGSEKENISEQQTVETSTNDGKTKSNLKAEP